MVLIHDDDLAQVQGDIQPDVLMGHLQSSKPEICRHFVGCYVQTWEVDRPGSRVSQ
jgi:hypothetical protein